MTLLFPKVWIDSRGRFFAALLGMVLVTAIMLLTYQLRYRAERLPEQPARAEMARRTGLELRRLGYAPFLQAALFGKLLVMIWPAYAFLLGTSGVVSPGGIGMRESGGAVSFALSLPVSRTRLLRAAIGNGAAQLLAVCLASMATIWLGGLYFGEPLQIQELLSRFLMIAAAGFVFFGLAHLLCALFDGVKPVLIGTLSLVTLLLAADGFSNFPRLFFVQVIGGYDYFFRGTFPWLRVGGCLALSALLLAAAFRRVATRDY